MKKPFKLPAHVRYMFSAYGRNFINRFGLDQPEYKCRWKSKICNGFRLSSRKWEWDYIAHPKREGRTKPSRYMFEQNVLHYWYAQDRDQMKSLALSESLPTTSILKETIQTGRG